MPKQEAPIVSDPEKIPAPEVVSPEDKKLAYREKARKRYHALTAEQKKERVRTSRYGKEVLAKLKQMKADLDFIYSEVFDLKE